VRKRILVAGTTVAVLMGITGGSALASPPSRAEDPFVCPVLTVNENAVEASGKFGEIGDGQYTFAPGAAGSAETFNGNVPNQATNADGAGSPHGLHSAPGDADYTAIWSGNQ
jgi:ABC-type phosphate transport system substrate-binding protein